MKQDLIIKPFELRDIFVAEDALQMSLELEEKLKEDQALLEKNNTKENLISYKCNEYLYYWLKYDYYNIESLSSKLEPSDIENGWFIWLKTYRISLSDHFDSVDDKNAAIYDKYFDQLLPALSDAGDYVKEALKCYKSEYYFPCACSLFSLIESVERKITQFDPSSKFSMSKQLRIPQAGEVISFNKTYFVEFEKRMDDFLLNYFYVKSYESDPEPKEINRNRVMHGILTRKVCKVDCVKLFVLLNSMLMFNDWLDCYRKMKEVSISIEGL